MSDPRLHGLVSGLGWHELFLVSVCQHIPFMYVIWGVGEALQRTKCPMPTYKQPGNVVKASPATDTHRHHYLHHVRQPLRQETQNKQIKPSRTRSRTTGPGKPRTTLLTFAASSPHTQRFYQMPRRKPQRAEQTASKFQKPKSKAMHKSSMLSLSESSLPNLYTA